MNPNKKTAGCAASFLIFIGALAVVCLLLATLYVNGQPTTGLALAEQARQAQIEQAQADTAKTLAETSKIEAEARAIERQSTVATLQHIGSVMLVGGVCLIVMLIVGTGAYVTLAAVTEFRKAYRGG